MKLPAVAGAAAATIAAAFGYITLLRPRLSRWGAMQDDIDRAMPCDDAITAPTVVTNRAITIDAPRERVWPWIAQMGEAPRGGFYSYVSVERLLGMHVHNARRILPDIPEPAVGDALDAGGNMLVKEIVPGECLVVGPPPGPDFASTWSLGVYPTTDGRTRFVSRVRVKYFRWTPGLLFIFLVLEPGQFIMERKMLLEVKRLAEAAPEPDAQPVA
jgi:hypothetical protein